MEKNQKPTQRKLREAGEKGTLCKSAMITQAVGLIGFLGWFLSVDACCWNEWGLLLELVFQRSHHRTFEEMVQIIGLKALNIMKLFIVAPLITGTICGYLSELSQLLMNQEGIQFRFSLLLPKMERIHCIEGAYRILSHTRVIPLLCLKIFLVFGMFFLLFREMSPMFFLLNGRLDLLWSVPITHLSSTMIATLCGWILPTFLILAVIDYGYQYRRFFRRLGMSLEEIRREWKEQDGDPTLKALRRGLQEAFLMQEIEQRVRRSKVILVERIEN